MPDMMHNPSDIQVAYSTPQPAHSQPSFTPLFNLFDAKKPVQHIKKNDALTCIKGINSDIEGKLNRIGITTYREVAEWTSIDIRRISAALGLGHAIMQQNWIVQAQSLYFDQINNGKNPSQPFGRAV